MNRIKMTSLALALALVAGAGGATLAFADHDDQANGRGDRGSWNSRGDRGWNTRGDRGWNSRGDRARDFAGVWRLDSRRGNAPGGWNNGWNGRGGDPRRYRNAGAAYLPDVIQIERARGELRVENQNGRLIRLLEMGRRGDWNGNQFRVESTLRGAKVTETFSLQDRGRELVVRTIVEGRRGLQQFTSVYDRA